MASAREIAAQLDEVAEEVTSEELEAEKAGISEEEEVPSLEGMEFAHLFAADVEPKVVSFRIKGAKQDSAITFLPMNADKASKFREAASRGLAVEAEYICLEHTITDLEIWFPNPKNGGKAQMQPLPKNAALRRKFYEDLLPDLRVYLYLECLKVNGFSPNP